MLLCLAGSQVSNPPAYIACSVLMDTPLNGGLPLDEDLWTELRTLQNLNLRNTGLSGFLPSQMAALDTIQFLSLGDNKLEGEAEGC